MTALRRPAGEVFLWRVLSANNRSLARSASVYVAQASAVEAARALLGSAGELDGDVVRVSATCWRWVASLGPRPVAVGGRPYERLLAARSALVSFQDALAHGLDVTGLTERLR